MKRYLFSFLWVAIGFAEMPSSDILTPKIAIQNCILAKVNGETISVIDVKKKMDLIFHNHYSHLEDSEQARLQFYQAHWRKVLSELVDHQLILADSMEKQVPLKDGEVREELENRFGPNIMLTLDKLDLSYDEAWKMIKDEMIVQRMTWWFIHSKAINRVTPQDIRQAYRMHLKENPPSDEWKYYVIAVRGEGAEEIANNVYAKLSHEITNFEDGLEYLKNHEPSVQVSSEFFTMGNQLSEAHKQALSSLKVGEYSKPILQKSRADQKIVARIFYLNDKIEHLAPQFDELSSNLKNDLIQKAIVQESSHYLDKLRRNYSFYEDVPKDFVPFSLNLQ